LFASKSLVAVRFRIYRIVEIVAAGQGNYAPEKQDWKLRPGNHHLVQKIAQNLRKTDQTAEAATTLGELERPGANRWICLKD
jgi:hypothetical protein